MDHWAYGVILDLQKRKQEKHGPGTFAWQKQSA